jgi:hypothetical protein
MGAIFLTFEKMDVSSNGSWLMNMQERIEAWFASKEVASRGRTA